jgi:hypothetical protein
MSRLVKKLTVVYMSVILLVSGNFLKVGGDWIGFI